MPLKMYVIARAQLNTVYQCVQGGHALAEYYRLHPELAKEWDNQYLIYLNTYDLNGVMDKLIAHAIDWAPFDEPDMEGCTTALACYCDGSLFKDLKLIGF